MAKKGRIPQLLQTLVNLKTRTWLCIIIFIAVAERIALYYSYRSETYSDTHVYRRLAAQILTGWAAYDGTRLPGYPLFMAWIGPDERIYLAQLFLGILITLLFFYIGWRISRRGWFAALTASAYTLNLQQVLVEADLLSETLTIFLLVLALAWLAWLIYIGWQRSIWKIILSSLGIGIIMGCAGLIRSLYSFLPVLSAAALLFFWRIRFQIRVTSALAVAVSGLAIIGLWVNFIHNHFHMWSLDAIGGYHLMNHAGPFFEYVPNEYADLRDTFIRYRDAQIAETGNPGNAIWDAIPELMKVTGLSFYSLSRLLADISIKLILHHPFLYLRNVIEGWINFWRVPIHWTDLPNPWVGIQQIIILAIRGWLVIINASFLAGTVAFFYWKFRQRVLMSPFTWLLTGMVWVASILQALVEFGDNPRYSLPTHAIVLVLVMWWLYCLLKKPVTSQAGNV